MTYEAAAQVNRLVDAAKDADPRGYVGKVLPDGSRFVVVPDTALMAAVSRRDLEDVLVPRELLEDLLYVALANEWDERGVMDDIVARARLLLRSASET